MRVLALEPYDGGSHRTFLAGWIGHSRHAWTCLGLPAHHWKWRMRHAAMTLAEQVQQLAPGTSWDLLLASDMLNLAEFAGLVPAAVHRLPRVVYFHENQLTYPVRHPDPRDLHFAFTNLASALAADAVWFNSAFHRERFLAAMEELLGRMPDDSLAGAVPRIERKSSVQPPGIEAFSARGPRRPGPLRILWAARWEHDKNPDDLFRAVEILTRRGVAFRLSVIGEQFRRAPAVFAWARERFAAWIDRWGFQATRAEYRAALEEADVIVSTAQHEFFGISVVEALAAGCQPLLPRRLAYPEILAPLGAAAEQYFFDGSPDGLADHLERLAGRAAELAPEPALLATVARFAWPERAAAMDTALGVFGDDPGSK